MKLRIIILFGLVIILGIISTKSLYKSSYKLGNALGYSKSIEESKKRDVFIKELSFKVIPDSIKTIDSVVFFIEKRWRYGINSAKQTLPIKNGELKYSFIKTQNAELFEDSKYALGKGDSIYFNNLKDTIKFDIVYRKDISKIVRDQYENVQVLGNLILYPPAGASSNK